MGTLLLLLGISIIFLGCTQEACDHHKARWYRVVGTLGAALFLTLLLYLSRTL